MTQFSAKATTIDADSAAPIQVATGATSDDGDGERAATLLFERGTDAVMELPGGETKPLDDLTVRATEYTIGEHGDEAMPGELPATSAYTYAVEFSVDPEGPSLSVTLLGALDLRLEDESKKTEEACDAAGGNKRWLARVDTSPAQFVCYDIVAFELDTSLSLGTGGVSITLTGRLTSVGWKPFGIEWLTVNAMKSAFAPFDQRLRLINEVIKPRYASLRDAGLGVTIVTS